MSYLMKKIEYWSFEMFKLKKYDFNVQINHIIYKNELLEFLVPNSNMTSALIYI